MVIRQLGKISGFLGKYFSGKEIDSAHMQVFTFLTLKLN